MDKIFPHELKQLASKQSNPCISLYLPTHKKGKEIDQDPIRFKNLIRAAEKELNNCGFDQGEAKKIMEPATQLLGDSFFWSHQDQGLAVFITRDEFHTYRLPFSFNENVIVRECYYVKPLVPLLVEGGDFLILALSQKNLRLFNASQYNMEQIELENVPKSIKEALKYDVPERQLQYHTGTGTGKGRRAAMFHGQGVGTDDVIKKKNILQYFQLIDNGINDILKDETRPMIVVGLEFLLPIYRQTNSYGNFLDEIVSNADELTDAELYRKGWERMRQHLNNRKREALDEFKKLHGTGKASGHVEEIVRAAAGGRVKYLLVDITRTVWGAYLAEADQVTLHEQRKEASEDLMDVAVAQTILHDGKVYDLESRQMPEHNAMAAVLRY